jgi:peptide/nickel transport system permease protein
VSLTVGIVSVGISALIGILLGAFAGYFGDNRLRVTRARLLGGFAGTVLGFFYAFQVRAYTLSDALGSPEQSFLFALSVSLLIFVGCIFLGSQALRPLERIPALAKQVAVGADLAISRLIEVMVSIPTLLLIVSIAAIAEPSLYLVMVVIGLTTWTGIARFTRAEFLRVRNLEYVQAAQAQGFGELRIIFRHALPNAIAPVFIAIAFGVAAAVLVESSLSFLGIGVPPTTVTWGSLLSSVREKFDAWWLAVFPGFAIFLTVTCFNLLGEGLRDALDPRLRS